MTKAAEGSSFLKKARVARLFLLPGFILSLLCAPPAALAAAQKQLMRYDVYAGGFHVVSADLTVDLSAKKNYLLRLAAYTHGILARLAPWNGVFQTEGWYDGRKAHPQPELHFSDTTWRDENERTEFKYNKNGSFREYSVKNEEKNGPEEKDAELTQGTIDVLTATLKVMQRIAKEGACEGRNEIFDGARRYALIYANHKEATLKKSDLNVYAGPAVECTVEVKPIAGKWHEKPRGWMSIQEQGRERGTMPTIWFAKMADGEPAVPVKIRVKTDYGTLFMHLTGYKGAGQALEIARN